VLRVAYEPTLMAFVLVRVTSSAAVVIAAVIIGAAALQAKLNGRPF
jgi:hypothetical protein